MKRNLKPFTVEIKKSRAPGQHHQLPPRPLFAPMQVEVARTVQPEEPQAVSEQPAPRRILPSIVEPRWSRSESAEPVRRTEPSGANVALEQMQLDLDAITSEDVKDASAEVMIPEAMSQADVPPVVEEDVEPVHEVHILEAEVVEVKPRKPRRPASETVEQVVASEPVSEPALAPATEVVEPSPVVTPRKLSHHRLTRRQATAGRLPRHERWKRRLHPACW
jgi:hypothetical protein